MIPYDDVPVLRMTQRQSIKELVGISSPSLSSPSLTGSAPSGDERIPARHLKHRCSSKLSRFDRKRMEWIDLIATICARYSSPSPPLSSFDPPPHTEMVEELQQIWTFFVHPICEELSVTLPFPLSSSLLSCDNLTLPPLPPPPPPPSTAAVP
jgi:hypothetical protein